MTSSPLARSPSEYPWTWFFVVVLLLVPLFVVDIPPILDYPNHLARLYLLGPAAADPILSQFYQARWAVIPDLAIDAFMPTLLRFVPLYLGGKILLGLVLLLTVASAIAYGRAVFGVRRAWALASVLVAYNLTFIYGFLNFLISIDLAMLFAAGWIVWRERRPRLTIVLASVGTCVLFLAHLMGFAIFLILVGSAELEAIWRLGRAGAGFGRVLMHRVAAAIPILVGPLVLYRLSAFKDVTGRATWPSWPDKGWEAICGFVNYSPALDIGSAALVFGFAILCLAFGKGRVAPKSVAAFVVLVALFAVLPFAFKDTNHIDVRPATMFAILMFAGMTPEGLPILVRRAAVAGVVSVFVVRMAVLTVVWHSYQTDVDAIRLGISDIPAGSKVFVSEATLLLPGERAGRRISDGRRTDIHVATLALVERHAFSPGVFAVPVQQPLIRRPYYETLANQLWTLPPYQDLVSDSSLFERFVCRFDYYLLLTEGPGSVFADFGGSHLTLLRVTPLIAAYRINLPLGGCSDFERRARADG